MIDFDPRSVYEAAAGDFSDARSTLYPYANERVLDGLRIRPNDQIFDAGCGAGDMAVLAAGLVGEGGSVLGVDIAPSMVRLARERARKAGVTHARFLVGDFEYMALEPESFDVVVCSFGIFFAKDVDATLRKLWRLLRPGGRLALTTVGRNFFSPVSGVFMDIAQSRLAALSIPQPWKITEDLADLRITATRAGLHSPCLEHEDYLVRLEDVSDWWRIIQGSGLRAITMLMDTKTLGEVRTTTEAWMREHDIRALTFGINYLFAEKLTRQRENEQ
ncbi:methyltransferase domain-containing protein [Streptomyces sp. NPDC005012]|uniref:methyltransferase domain-containing protein n=1 Tax=Streptomyces sp. NPDC005012 TaxID=3154558 RepID=UPI0033AADF97